MSGFAMQTAGVFLPLLKPSRYKGACGARGGAPEGKRNGNYRHGARTNDRCLEAHKITALTFAWGNSRSATVQDFLQR